MRLGLFSFIAIFVLSACGSRFEASDEYKRSLFKEPTDVITPTKAESVTDAYSVYKLVEAKVGADTKAMSVSAQVSVESTAGHEIVDLVGVLRPDGSASLVDVNPLPDTKNRLVAEALCVDSGVCSQIILNVYYNVEGKTLKRQFSSDSLRASAAGSSAPGANAPAKVDAPAKPDEAPAVDTNEAEDTPHPVEKKAPTKADPTDTTLGDYVGAPRNEILIGRLWPRSKTPELPPVLTRADDPSEKPAAGAASAKTDVTAAAGATKPVADADSRKAKANGNRSAAKADAKAGGPAKAGAKTGGAHSGPSVTTTRKPVQKSGTATGTASAAGIDKKNATDARLNHTLPNVTNSEAQPSPETKGFVNRWISRIQTWLVPEIKKAPEVKKHIPTPAASAAPATKVATQTKATPVSKTAPTQTAPASRSANAQPSKATPVGPTANAQSSKSTPAAPTTNARASKTTAPAQNAPAHPAQPTANAQAAPNEQPKAQTPTAPTNTKAQPTKLDPPTREEKPAAPPTNVQKPTNGKPGPAQTNAAPTNTTSTNSKPATPTPPTTNAQPAPKTDTAAGDADKEDDDNKYPFPPAKPDPNNSQLDQKITLLEAKLAPLMNLRDGGVARGGYTDSRENAVRSSIVKASLLPTTVEGLVSVQINHSAHWGTGMLVSFLENAATYLFQQLGIKLYVGDMSLKNGGAYGNNSSHNTHRNGLDADLAWVGWKRPLQDSALDEKGNVVDDFEYEKTWNFLKLASRQEIVEDAQKSTAISRVFMSPGVKTGFCAWAKDKGILDNAADSELMRLVRPTDGHYKHFHLSLKCSPHYPLCRNLAGPPPPGPGCD